MSGKRRVLTSRNETASKKGCRALDFEYKEVCLLCSSKKDRQKIRILRTTNEKLLEKLEQVADIRKDTHLVARIRSLIRCNVADEAKYHALCYKDYTGPNRIAAALSRNKQERPVLATITAAKSVLNDLKDYLNQGRVFLLKTLTELFVQKMSEEAENYSDVQVRSTRVKEWFISAGNGDIAFHSLGNGRPDVMCKADLCLSDILSQCLALLSEVEGLSTPCDVRDSTDTDLSCLFRSSKILKNIIDSIPATERYPAAPQCDLAGSLKFVPPDLAKFITWTLYSDEKNQMKDVSELSPQELRRVLTICETMIYCSRRRRNGQVIPPFHMGLAMHLANETGSALTISQLHCYGQCISFDEVRRFLTVAAEEELRGHQTEYIPKALIHRNEGGALIQEGDDNVDINTETVTGKDTYHAMARVYFQKQSEDELKPSVSLARARRRSLNVSKNDMLSMKILHFPHPIKKVEPNAFPNGSSEIQNLLKQAECLNPKDVIWALLRGVGRGLLIFADSVPKIQAIPFWAGYNTRKANTVPVPNLVCYAPTINAKPADVSTVYTTLKRGKAVAEACGQPYSVHTFDQQLYAVAQQVKLSCPLELDSTVLRMGGFHSLSTFIACIFKVYGRAGLLDMLVDSGVYAANTAELMAEGKHFYRAVRGLTIVYEALIYLLMENFQAWLLEMKPALLETFTTITRNAFEGYAEENWNGEDMTEFSEFVEKSLLRELNKFIAVGRKNIPVFSFWMDCILALQIMLNHLRAERVGDWHLHLSSQAAMLPYFFACDRVNYARWSPLYVLEMISSLPAQLREEFENGHHSISHIARAYNGEYSDIATEESVIKHTKSDTGISGFTRRDGTVLRWEVTRHILAMYSHTMRGRSGFRDNVSDVNSHEQESTAFFARDEFHVQQVIDHIKTSMTDPFSALGNQELLIHIGSGMVAAPEVKKSLLNVVSTGKAKLIDFVEARLQTDPETRATLFHNPIKKSSLRTFADMLKPTPLSINGKVVKKAVSAEVVFARALEIKKIRGDSIDLEVVLSHPLTSVPPSLFRPDGTRRTTPKSEAIHALEEMIADSQNSEVGPSEAYVVLIVDAMAVLQKLDIKITSGKTFGEVAEQILRGILQKFKYSDEIHFLFDRYDADEVNPKSLERRRRYASGEYVIEIEEQRRVQNWKKIMASDEMKAAMTDFLSKYLEKHIGNRMSHGNKLYLGGGYKDRVLTRVISVDECRTDDDFSCNHSEADTRIIFHIAESTNALTLKPKVIVESPDTDVLILLIAHYEKFKNRPNVLFRTGVGATCRDISVQKICDCLEQTKTNSCRALLSVHALTGCDTVSSLFYIGKKSALSSLLNYMTEEDLVHLCNFGCHPLNANTTLAATRFVASLYDPRGKFRQYHSDINRLRTRLAMKHAASDRLPPSEPALHQHILRSAWQVHVWAQANQGIMTPVSPLDSGWALENNIILPVYFSGPSGLELMQKFLCICKGKNPCTKPEVCPCQENALECCELCLCSSTCQNGISNETM